MLHFLTLRAWLKRIIGQLSKWENESRQAMSNSSPIPLKIWSCEEGETSMSSLVGFDDYSFDLYPPLGGLNGSILKPIIPLMVLMICVKRPLKTLESQIERYCIWMWSYDGFNDLYEVWQQ